MLLRNFGMSAQHVERRVGVELGDNLPQPFGLEPQVVVGNMDVRLTVLQRICM